MLTKKPKYMYWGNADIMHNMFPDILPCPVKCYAMKFAAIVLDEDENPFDPADGWIFSNAFYKFVDPNRTDVGKHVRLYSLQIYRVTENSIDPWPPKKPPKDRKPKQRRWRKKRVLTPKV